jgi:hypothetical protein
MATQNTDELQLLPGPHPPWPIEARIFAHLTDYLTYGCGTTAAEVAASIAALRSTNHHLADGDQDGNGEGEAEKEEDPASFFLELRDIGLRVASQLPPGGVAMGRQVDALAALGATPPAPPVAPARTRRRRRRRRRGALERASGLRRRRHRGAPAAFALATRPATGDAATAPAEVARARRTGFHAFLALLAAAGVARSAYVALSTLARALEAGDLGAEIHGRGKRALRERVREEWVRGDLRAGMCWLRWGAGAVRRACERAVGGDCSEGRVMEWRSGVWRGEVGVLEGEGGGA